MRVCFVTQYFPPEIGAPQARLSGLARAFVSAGHEVWVVTAMPNYPEGKIQSGYGGLVRREVVDGINTIRTAIYPSRSLRMAPRMASYLSFVLSSFMVGAALLPRRFDYLLTESPPLFLGMSGWALSRLKRAKWIFNVSDLWPASAVWLGIVGEGWALRMAEKLEAFCYRKSWLVSGQTRGIISDIEQRFPQVGTYHLPNGADTELFRPNMDPGPFRERFGVAGECVAVYTGLLGAAQGLGQLLEALSLIDESVRLRLVLVGDGPEREKLKARANELGLDNVEFMAPVPKDQVPLIHAAADIGIASLGGQIPDAVPSKIYEVMAMGNPLLLVAKGDAATLVHDHRCGVTVDPGDIAGIAAALTRLAMDPKLRGDLGSNGRAAATSVFDRKRIATRFMDVLDQGLHKRSDCKHEY